ncbi:hypothetical protein B0H13DRAFT_2276534 [Mycena leptocephala]|nr:hypothetical protein B0H13DRAFT_2276534 [Mycena leptocephala]
MVVQTPVMFEGAANISQGEIKAYRRFAFPPALGDSTHDPFFSVEHAPDWITSRGYQLYLEHDDGGEAVGSWNPDNATPTQVRAYRAHMISEHYIGHRFFSLDNTDLWIRDLAFQAYMDTFHGSFDEYRTRQSTPFSSRAPSRSASSIGSRAPSRADSSFSAVDSRPSSRASVIPSSYAPSSRSSSPISFNNNATVLLDGEDDSLAALAPPRMAPMLEDALTPSLPADAPPTIAKSRKGKQKASSPGIRLTRELAVDEIVPISTIPATWTVPRVPAAYLVELHDSIDVLKVGNRTVAIDGFIRSEDQDSWGGSGGHAKGDVQAAGFLPDLTESILCRRCHLSCNGIYTCEFFDATLFADCQRYEPDEEAMRALWRLELDANEREAASEPGRIARLYAQIQHSRCKIKCDGVPILKEYLDGTLSSKPPFIGCTKWNWAERFDHRYLPISDNINLNTLRFVMDNDGHLPGPPLTLNATCSLTVHPRIGKGLQHCPYSHILDGKIRTGRIVHRKCSTQMIIFVPIDKSSPVGRKTIVIPRNPHNHPTHPKTKPSADDRNMLSRAVEAIGVVGLTPQNLLNASSTALVYEGQRVAAVSPAFMDNRKVRKFIEEQKRKDYPRGMGWDGVLHHLSTKEPLLPKSERYIHTAMSKNGFKLVVTMQPQIASHMHNTLALNIDFTFKRVDGTMNEWEVAGMTDRFNRRLTFGSLFCDTASTEAFTQLFIELFDTITQVTGKPLKLAPFFPDANCRIVMLDGEVPQALGLGHFLAIYNNPAISGINSRDPVELLSHCLKTCEIHFERHIDELPRDISRTVIHRLKSITHLTTQAEIDDWHEFCASQTHIDIKNWYAHKVANTWVLPSVNKYLSKISHENWDITPNQSNIAETAHAGRNAETSIGVGLLTAILQSQARDNVRATELLQIERDGVTRKRWNGVGNREKLSAQRKVWRMKATAIRNDQLNSYDSLKSDRDAGLEDNKASLERQKQFEAEIKSLQEEMKIDRHRSDLKEKVIMLRREIDEEKAGRREWALRRAEIDSELAKLRGGPLAGVRINGRRPAERPLDDAQTAPDASLVENEEDADLYGGVEIETDSSLNLQEPSTPFNTVEPSGADVTDISRFKPSSSNFPDLPQRSERQLWDSSFNIPSFLSSSADFLDPNEQFEQSGITDNDLEMNSYNPTEDFLSYLEDPVFLRNLEMGATSLNMEADLPQLPMPMPSSPITESSDLPSAYPEMQGPSKKRTREPEVDEANIVAGSRQRTKSRRALGQ